jgi:tricarboxylate carrier
MSSKTVKLDIDKSEYDLTTYFGRLQSMFDITNPIRAFVSTSTLNKSKAILDEYYNRRKLLGVKEVDLTEIQANEIREANKICKSIFHPDTGKPIPTIFRMSWYVPASLPIIFGLICTKQTWTNIILWQWINQTYNAGWNFSNRNASASFTNKDLSIAYGAAVGSSVSVACLTRYISNKLIKVPGSITKQRLINSVVSTMAMSVAGFLNLYFIRQNELSKGIDVQNENGETIGKSQKAAHKAVISSATTRSLLPLTQVVIIPGLYALIECCRMMPKSKVGLIGVDLLICAINLGVSLPLALAAFTQNMQMPKADIEPEIAAKSKGFVYFNKGL